MTRIVLILIILVIMIAGYFYLPATESDTLNTTNTEASPAHNATHTKTDNDKQRYQALTHIKKMTDHAEKSIDASIASHFVTEEQLIKLPDTSSTRLSIGQSGDINPLQTAQTFGVSVSVFNPKNNTLPDNQQPTGDAPAGTVIQLKELLDQSDSNGKNIFYIHAVNQNDEQGIWGILQNGLTDTFARGITLSDSTTLIQTIIPEEADETLENRKSSFLGKLLHEKVSTTHIYNFQQGLLGQNPNMIRPGQQLIIVTFTEEELLNVYQHYSQKSQSQ
jgi:hypothetical protein